MVRFPRHASGVADSGSPIRNLHDVPDWQPTSSFYECGRSWILLARGPFRGIGFHLGQPLQPCGNIGELEPRILGQLGYPLRSGSLCF
jgi:hypothetical protein